MADTYSWQSSVTEPSYRSTRNDHLGWWAAAAMFVSILLHVVVLFALDQVKFVLGIEPKTIQTERVVVTRQTDTMPQDFVAPPPPEEVVQPPPTTSPIDEIEILNALKDQEIEMSPEVKAPEFAVAMGGNPKQSGSPEGLSESLTAGLNNFEDLPTPGRTAAEIRPAAMGQMIIDPGSTKADTANLDSFADSVKKGANGTVSKGAMDGLSSIDELLGLNSNQLSGKKTMLPSDLLFEFNKYELRESAKFGLNKLGTLIDLNPTMYCWIEGHTDLIGSDSANLELSRKRAEAVKEYLVTSMRMPADKIITRGFGEFEPIVTGGDPIQQSPNRRVEIKMRKTPPTADQIKITPPKAPVIEEMPPAAPVPAPAPAIVPEPAPAPPPRAVRVMPNIERAVPVEVVPAPKARPVAEPAPEMAPRAVPVKPETAPPARALPVEEPPALRAQPVQE